MSHIKTSRNAIGGNREKGQALVEFTLTILLIFLLFVGMLEMILLLYAYNTLANAAKEGVRYAIVHGTGSSTVNGGVGCSGPGLPSATPPVVCSTSPYPKVQNWVTNFASLSMQSVAPSDVTVDYNPNSANGVACNVPGCLVRVTVQKIYRPFFGLGWPSLTIYAAADGRIMN
jgi:Flp pilus assembly protein TadG